MLGYMVEEQATHSTAEILAQSMCQASASSTGQTGRVYAVGRRCVIGGHTCNQICASTQLRMQDVQTRHSIWSCINAYHVYKFRPATNIYGSASTAILGLKSASTGCHVNYCGPNFCCCFAALPYI